jgi:photosystem II stability/assembly factor-like uncharacterized protein
VENAANVYVSMDDGASWSAVGTGSPPNTAVTSLAVSGENLFAGTDGSGVFLSADNGASWIARNNGLAFPHANIQALVVTGTAILAGTTEGGVFRSDDNGQNWHQSTVGLLYTRVYAFAVSGTNIFAGTERGVFLSTDGGSVWAAVNTGLPLRLSNPSQSAHVPSVVVHDGALYAGVWGGTDYGVYKSTNNGASWSADNKGMLSNAALCCVLTVSGTHLVAGTAGAGIWRRSLTE